MVEPGGGKGWGQSREEKKGKGKKKTKEGIQNFEFGDIKKKKRATDIKKLKEKSTN